ncbi:hypothetical protein AgCh_034997 [Apium graveolens]
MEKKLYGACLKGDIDTLKAMMEEDELTLARVSISSCFNQTPLHVASMLGHFEFAKSLLSYEADFASRLDSQSRSPLHLASANGYADLVKILLEYDPNMCQVSDEDGRTPLHLAVMNGQLECVSELTKVHPKLCDEETTVLHLCVMYNRLNVLILILESNGPGLSNIKDKAGNTILHSATTLRRMQIVKYLVMSRIQEVDVDAVNENGFTALDIVEQMPKDVNTIEIKELLISAGTLRAKASKTTSLLIPEVGGVADQNLGREPATDSNSKLVKMWKKVKRFTFFQEKREKRDKILLVAASVIAAMAYQATISPPGGVAGTDATKDIYGPAPANSLLAYYYPDLSDSGATLKQRFFVWLIRAAMWITLTSMIMAYSCAVAATTQEEFATNSTAAAVTLGLLTWLGLIILSISFIAPSAT